LAVTVTDLDPTAAEFLRTSDEGTLLRVIRTHRQRGRSADDREAARSGSAESG
jgi:hypothetical protein